MFYLLVDNDGEGNGVRHSFALVDVPRFRGFVDQELLRTMVIAPNQLDASDLSNSFHFISCVTDKEV